MLRNITKNVSLDYKICHSVKGNVKWSVRSYKKHLDHLCLKTALKPTHVTIYLAEPASNTALIKKSFPAHKLGPLGAAAVFVCRNHRVCQLFSKFQCLQWKISGSYSNKCWHLVQPRLNPLSVYLSENKLTWPIWAKKQFSFHLQIVMSRFWYARGVHIQASSSSNIHLHTANTIRTRWVTILTVTKGWQTPL